MTNVKVSFIIPVYNASIKELKNCISSILAIEGFSFEVIMIDDGSLEKNAEKYCAYVGQFDQGWVKLIRQKNQGVSAARNKGIENAQGEYIMFVDSDDILCSEALKPYFGTSDFVIYDYEFVKGKQKQYMNGIEGPPGKVEQERFLWYVLRGRAGFSCGKLYRNDFLKKTGVRFEQGCIQGEDADFNFALMKQNPSVEYINCAIYQYNFSSFTALRRWAKHPDKMLYSADARFQRNMEYIENNDLADREKKSTELLTMRVRAIYQNGIDLCCVDKATAENRQKVERLMKEITLPENADFRTEICYRMIVKRRWSVIWIIAKLRMLYLHIRKI